MSGKPALVFQGDSDSDSINTDTTAESDVDEDKEYAVEKILAEQLDPHGNMLYLIKWESYPLHRCTWETPANIMSNLLLKDWDREKLAVRRGESDAFDIELFNLAVEKWQDEIADKARRRRAKRRKRGDLVASPLGIEETSDSDGKLAKSPPKKHRISKSTSIKRKGRAQPAAKKRRGDSFVAADSSSSDDSDVPLRIKMQQSSIAATNATPKARQVSLPKLDDPQAQASLQRPGLARAQSSHAKGSSSEIGPASRVGPSPNSTVTTAQDRQPVATTAARKSVATQSAPLASSKAAVASKVFRGNWAESKEGRRRARVSGDTPKDSTDPKFALLSIQNRFQKYSRNEPIPDVNALSFPDPQTGKFAIQKSTTNTVAPKTGPAVLPNVYDRRTPPPVARRRSLSPPRPPPSPLQEPPSGARPLLPPLTTSVASSLSRTPASAGLPAKQRTCRWWQEGVCRYTAETCAYAHSDVKKRTTCYYWYHHGNCNRSEDQCQFAHYDTGIYAGEPGSFYKRNRTAPETLPAQFVEDPTTTNALRPAAVVHDVPQLPTEPPPPVRPSVIVDSRNLPNADDTSDDLTNDLFRSPNTPMSPSFGQRATADNAMAYATDPRLAPRAPRVDVARTSPPRDPRLRRQSEVPVQSTLPKADSPILPHGSIDSDLEHAVKMLPLLDAVRLLKEPKGGLIENVFIHMPQERKGEVRMLSEYFQRLNCKVLTSHAEGNQWNTFIRSYDRKFERLCLLVVHPSESFAGTIPHLSNYLVERRHLLRVFSIGVQHQQCILEQREPAYEARRLFPGGLFVYITDDVFIYYPEQATELIDRFLAMAKDTPPDGPSYKIGARPGIKDWMRRFATKKYHQQVSKKETIDARWSLCHEALCRLCPAEAEDPDYPGYSVPIKSSYLWSPWEETMPSLKGRWEGGDEEGTTEYMVENFAGEACMSVWKYRKFVVVYQRPELKNGQNGPETKKTALDSIWMRKYCHIGVTTPDQAINSIRTK